MRARRGTEPRRDHPRASACADAAGFSGRAGAAAAAAGAKSPPEPLRAPAAFAPPRGELGDDSRHHVLRAEFPAHDPETVFHALFDPAGALLAKHLRENCGATELVSREVVPSFSSSSLGASRSVTTSRCVSYSAPTSYKFPNMPKRCEVRDVQEYTMRRASESSESPDTHACPRSRCDRGGVRGLRRVLRGGVDRASRRPGESTGAAVEVSCAIDWKNR